MSCQIHKYTVDVWLYIHFEKIMGYFGTPEIQQYSKKSVYLSIFLMQL